MLTIPSEEAVRMHFTDKLLEHSWPRIWATLLWNPSSGWHQWLRIPRQVQPRESQDFSDGQLWLSMSQICPTLLRLHDSRGYFHQVSLPLSFTCVQACTSVWQVSQPYPKRSPFSLTGISSIKICTHFLILSWYQLFRKSGITYF